jgi:biopolymer transport protein ExbD
MNVTPLVDVVLVLLIIFMVVIPAMEAGAEVELPTIVNVEADPEDEPVVISIEAGGTIWVDEDVVERDELEEMLRFVHEGDPTRRVVIKADREARYADARFVFAASRTIGFPSLSLQVSEIGVGAGEGDEDGDESAH